MDPVRDVTGRHTQDGGSELPRTHLIEEFRSARNARMILVRAPAGYSKTTTLRLWDSADPRPFFWVRGEQRHNDPSVLIEALVTAFDASREADTHVLGVLGSPRPDFDLVLRRLGGFIGRRDPFVLVIDDAQKIESSSAWRVFQRLVAGLPENAQLAIVTRSSPGFPVADLRVHGELHEIGAKRLALTRSESRTLLEALGPGPAIHADEIHVRAEGWPVAVYLAGLAIRNGGGTASQQAGFDGNGSALIEYFREEFLHGLPEDRLRFLYETSILQELSGGLCDAVTGRNDSRLLLDELVRNNALVVTLDQKAGEYRYRHLFAELLRTELRLREPEQEPVLHNRAATWFAATGRIARATDHAIQSGDFEFAGTLIWHDFPTIAGRGRIATLDNWLELIGHDRIAEIPALTLSRLHRELIMGRGEEARYWLTVAEREIDEHSDDFGDLLMARAMIGADGPGGMVDDAGRAAGLLAPANPWRVAARLYRGIGLFLEGDAGAGELLRSASRESVEISPIFQVLALAQLTLLELEAGRVGEASSHVARARDRVEQLGLGELREMSLVFAVLARTLARQGRRDEAAEVLGRSIRMSDELHGYIDWYEAELLIVTVQALLDLGRTEAAADLADRAEEATGRASNPALLVRWLDEARQALG